MERAVGATTPAPKSHRRIAPRRHAAVTAAPRPPVAPAERVGVVHLTAEYWPFARTGGLGEAVSGLATTQAAAGHPTTVVMPLDRKSTRLNSSHSQISYA